MGTARAVGSAAGTLYASPFREVTANSRAYLAGAQWLLCGSPVASSRRSVLPDGEVGMASVNTTWWIRLCSATRALTYSINSSAATGRAGTMYALGSSPARSSETGTTAASATAGWLRSSASSSAGRPGNP